MILFIDHAGIFGHSFRFTLSIFFLFLGARLLKRVFIFLLLLPFIFPPNGCGVLGAVDCTGLTLEVWEGGFIGILVWIDELGLIALFSGLYYPVI
jgi:hypothetical protein